MEGWQKAESEECGFGRVIVESLEVAEDVMGEVGVEDITECVPKAARAVEFEAAGKRNRLVKKTTEHLEAEKNLSRRTGEELKMAKSNLAKRRRKYTARRIVQTLQKANNKNEGCLTIYLVRTKKGTTCDRQKWNEELERYSTGKNKDVKE